MVGYLRSRACRRGAGPACSLARGRQRQPRQDKAEKVGQNQGGGGHRLLACSLASWQRAQRLQKRREAQGQRQSSQLRTTPHCPTRRRKGLVGKPPFSRSSQASENAFSSRTLKADSVSYPLRGKTSLAQRSGLMRISWPQTHATPWAGCGTAWPWWRTASQRSTCGRLAQDTFEHLQGWLDVRCRMVFRAGGARAAWFQCLRNSGSP